MRMRAWRLIGGLSLAVAMALPATPETAAAEADVRRPAEAIGTLSGGAALPALPGQRAEAFVAAVALWLEDDEAAGLSQLGALARAGNPSAQLLLGLIDRTPALQGPWLAHLPPVERLALLRMPGGMSGRSWLHAAAEAMPLAQLWLTLREVTAPVDVIIDFALAGEPRAARLAALTIASREVRGFDRIAAAPGYPEAVRYLTWRESGLDRASELARLAPGDPQRRMTGEAGAAPDAAALTAWLLQAPEAASIATLCVDRCPADAGACALAAWEALASHRALMVLGSPSERLIPSAVFHASRRGQGAVLRRVLLAVDARGRRLQLARAQERDACFAGLLGAEAQRYMIKRD